MRNFYVPAIPMVDTSNWSEVNCTKNKTPDGWNWDAEMLDQKAFYSFETKQDEFIISKYLTDNDEVMFVLYPNDLGTKFRFAHAEIDQCLEKAKEWIAGDVNYRLYRESLLTKEENIRNIKENFVLNEKGLVPRKRK